VRAPDLFKRGCRSGGSGLGGFGFEGLNFVAEGGGGFEGFLGDGGIEVFLQFLDSFLEFLGVLVWDGDFADVTGALVHGFEKGFQTIAEDGVAFWAAEAAGFFKVGLGEAAFFADGVVGIFFLGFRAGEAEEEIGEGEAGGIVDAFFIGARLAEVDLLHFAFDDLGEVDRGFSFVADVTDHKLVLGEG
jgi:hypothetical protein